MKNKVNIFGIIVFITVIGFAVTACDNDIKPDVDVVGATLRLYDKPVTIDPEAADCTATNFAYIYYDGLLSDYISGTPEVNLVNGKLTIKLDTPKPEAMFTVFDFFDDNLGVDIGNPGINATLSLDEVFCLSIFSFYESEGEYFLEFVNEDTGGLIYLMYVDKTITINGATVDSEYEDTFDNVILYQGWNYLIRTMDDDNYIFTSTRNEPSGFNWTLLWND